MKRFFAMVLALCLVCGATALAADLAQKNYGTKVSYVLPECMDYEVTIPPEIKLAPSADSAEVLTGKAELTMDVSKINVDNFSITVTLSGAENAKTSGDFFLNNADGSDSAPYYLLSYDNSQLAIGDIVAVWTANHTKTTSWELSAYAQAESFKNAGLHTDRLTFSVATNR